jgi:hypothetical protein
MVDDAEHGAIGTVAAEARRHQAQCAQARLISPTTRRPPRRAIRLDHLGHEFMAGRAGEAVVAALQFQVGIADAAAEQAEQRVAFGPVGQRRLAETTPFSRCTRAFPL